MKTVLASEVPELHIRVYAKRGALALARAAAAFALNKTETGRLFGISRQAVDQWYKGGVPVERLGDVGRLADLASALQGRFKSDRLPQIVRSPLPGLRRRSILSVIREKGTAPVFELLDRAFSYLDL